MKAQHDSPFVAVDIGGTKILAAIFSADGRMLDKEICATPAGDGFMAVIERLGMVVDTLLRSNEIRPSNLAGIGIACAGGIDTERGVVVTPSPNLPDWTDVPLRDIVEELFGIDTFILNDASSAALGEQRYGAGRGVKNLVLLTLGTGIGGGIIIDGDLYLGAAGGAGEIGHMTIEENGPQCGCGNTGCLEMLASGKAVAREAAGRISRGEESLLTGMVSGKVEDITAEMVGAAAGKGDVLAREVLAWASHYLGVGLVNVVNIFNPEVIVLGGGMAELGSLFIDPARKMVLERSFSVSARAVEIVTARLGNEAGVYGAAAYAIERKARREE
jgi:glucokinase